LHKDSELPGFATNKPESNESVANEVNRLFRVLREKFKQTPEISIATAYINPSGFNLLADELEAAPRVRLLIGAEPDQKAVQAKMAGEKSAYKKLEAATTTHEEWLKRERDLTGFTRDAIAQAERLVKWLKSADPEGKATVEVRRFTKGFLHGKAYISSDPELPAVLAGSSNMTYAGLMLNAELNLGYPAGDQLHTKNVVDWFNEYWDQSEPYDLAAVYEEMWAEHTPWTIFMKMLYELYGSVLTEERPVAPSFDLARFQIDGISRIRRLLAEQGGAIVADEVGLGKTFLAGEVILEATDQKRQRVLIVCPAALKESMWKPFIDKYGFRLTDVMSYDEVRIKMDPEHPEHTQFVNRVKDYAMVVVDEAHNLRNSSAEKSKAIDRVIREGKYPKQVMLLTATPVNNSLRDLETLVSYFIKDDAKFAHLNIPSIRGYIAKAQDMDPENLTPEHLFELMDQVAVRRTRKFVKDHYPNEFLKNPQGESVQIKFPTPRVRRIDYELGGAGESLVNMVLAALHIDEDEDLFSAYETAKADPSRLMMARYTPSRYLKGAAGVQRIQIQNAGLLRSALLKRLESSPIALYFTLQTLITSHEKFLSALKEGYVLESEALNAWVSSESDDLDDVLEEIEKDELKGAKSASDYHVGALQADAESDLNLLGELLAFAELALEDEDPKFDALVAQLEKIATEARKVDKLMIPEGDRRKVIIFSTYTDTVINIHHKLSQLLETGPKSAIGDYMKRLAEPQSGAYKSVHKAGKSGGVDQGGRATVIENFAPKTAGRLDDAGRPMGKDLYDILVTTDVLAEGVNLQQAAQIINYDLPWNPMKIVQRHGRVDRLFSQHSEVHMGLFFPADHLDEMLGLQRTLERKLAQAEAAVGAANVLPDRENAFDVVFHDRAKIEEEFEQLLIKGGIGGALSGEEFRRRLFQQLENFKQQEEAIKALPFGSGSGFVTDKVQQNGYVFCARIGDSENPWFRYVAADEAWKVSYFEDKPRLANEQLVSLGIADPGSESMARVMPEEAYSGAFDAWQVAQKSIHEDWQKLTDPNNLIAPLPKSFRDAIEFVKKKGIYLGAAEQTRTLKRLTSVPPYRVATRMRGVLSLDLNDPEKIQKIVELLDEQGIQEASEPKALPPVSIVEVRLVAWMAVGKKKD
jgi:superfamily II DNA or RNA helicase/HKD family nuclease